MIGEIYVEEPQERTISALSPRKSTSIDLEIAIMGINFGTLLFS